MEIDFSQHIILENERVLLRPLSMGDFDDLLVFSLNEPDLWKYSLLPANGRAKLRAYLSLALEERKWNRSYPFIVFDKKTNEIAGSTRFCDYQALHNTIQLGYTWYGKKFQGTGLNKNCKLLLLSKAFDDWGLERVEFRADAENKRSIHAMKSIGCVEEGILRNNCAGAAGRRDSIVLSILKDEWSGGKKRALEHKIEQEKEYE